MTEEKPKLEIRFDVLHDTQFGADEVVKNLIDATPFNRPVSVIVKSENNIVEYKCEVLRRDRRWLGSVFYDEHTLRVVNSKKVG